ncbi:GGL domain-containing protein isoform X1 [Danio rerio]|uniref:GGL domain-containing protein isoform X1 n=1 Tax=Danio rerio TaxID=7955 RepID=A0AC58IAH2_DANRE
MKGFNIPMYINKRYKHLQNSDIRTSLLKPEHLSSTPQTKCALEARRAVEQLRMETELQRIKISAAAEQLVQYCQEHRRADPLLTGIAASSNPFKDKKTCVLL